jgi:hypothetical protein
MPGLCRTYSLSKSTIATNRIGVALTTAMSPHRGTNQHYGTLHLQYKQKTNVTPAAEMGRYATLNQQVLLGLGSTPPITWKVSNKKLRIIRHATLKHAALVALRLAQNAQTLE